MRLLALLLLLVPALPPKGPPNVVILLADDAGWGDYGHNGNKVARTPHIDSLARDGARFDRFFVCSVCAPTRAEFLSGRWHSRGGVRGVSTGQERLDLGEKTVADAFKAAGHATGAFGKWHNGSQWPYHPRARGFDTYYGHSSGHWGEYVDPPLEHDGRMVREKGYIVDLCTDRALSFIERHRDAPFFCYVPFTTPHSPWRAPDEDWARWKERPIGQRAVGKEDLDETRCALAMLENQDRNVGRILAKIDELKLRENTVVLYFSDNGPNGWRWNGGMKGRKGSTDEGGVRSPFLIRWPGHIKAGTRIPQIAGAIDFLPTLADLAGVPFAGKKPLDGVSLKPLLLGTAKDWPDRAILSHWNGKFSLRTQRHRLDDAGRLYDMEADPGQDRDLSKEQPEATARLQAILAPLKKELALPKKDDRPFSVGYPESPVTPLPARDGEPHGGVKRSAGAPNCSYFTNWTRPEDRIAWPIEVATAGAYEVTLYYTCPKADVGSTVELTFNGAKLEGTVSEPHDPPLFGAEHDRASRGSESYVKDFKPMRLGRLELKAGRGELSLRAPSVPGRQVMDVRMVLLTLEK